MTGHAVYHLSFVICHSLSVIGGGAGNWKIRGSGRHRSGGGRVIALEISNLVWLAGTPARRYFHREGQFQILLSARYLRSHQHCAHPGGLDLETLKHHAHDVSSVVVR
jgi:hypothetical protein